MAVTAHRQSRLSALATVLMAVLVLVLAWGSDGTSSARAAVGNATGPLVADSLNGGAILRALNMTPGDVKLGEVTVTNVGDSAGAMVLGTSDLADVTQRGGVLSKLLELTVLDVTRGRAPTVVYYGTLAGLSSIPLGNFQQNEAHRYRFLVDWPDGNAPEVDNTYMGASSQVSFVWTASQLQGNNNGGGNGNGNGTPGGGGGSGPVPPVAPLIVDNVGPSKNPGAFKLRVYVRRVQAAHRQRVYVNVHCSAGCQLTATGVASLPSQKKSWTLKTLRATVKTNGTKKFRIYLAKSSLKRLDRALRLKRRASVKLKITARSGAQTVRWTRTIRLAR